MKNTVMKSLGIISFAASLEFKPKFPERTAKRHRGWDVEFVQFSSRDAMGAAIQKLRLKSPDPVYHPCIPFKIQGAESDGES